MKTVVYVIERQENGQLVGFVSGFDYFMAAYTLHQNTPLEFMLEQDAVRIAEHKNRALALNGYKDVAYVVKKRDIEETVIPLPALSTYLEDRPTVEIEGVDEAEAEPKPRKRQPKAVEAVAEVSLEDNPDAEVEIEG